MTAYHGAAPLITDKKGILPAAVGIHAVEAYHAGLVRTTINAVDASAQFAPVGTLIGYTQTISAARSSLANPDPKNPITSPFKTFAGSTADDQGVQTTPVSLNGSSATFTASTIADTDVNALGFGRKTTQILAIVTGNPATATSFQGVFFPSGLNGTIS